MSGVCKIELQRKQKRSLANVCICPQEKNEGEDYGKMQWQNSKGPNLDYLGYKSMAKNILRFKCNGEEHDHSFIF